MPDCIVLSASPSVTSRTLKIAHFVSERLEALGLATSLIDVRLLSAADLILANTSASDIAKALSLVESARALVIASPVYKAAYSGLLKVFLDLLPQYGLRGKVVFPLLTGASPAHVLAIDYALRPMLCSMDPLQILPGLYIIDKQVEHSADGRLRLPEEITGKLDSSLRNLAGWPPSVSSSVIAAAQ
jgi:FMN reductase